MRRREAFEDVGPARGGLLAPAAKGGLFDRPVPSECPHPKERGFVSTMGIPGCGACHALLPEQLNAGILDAGKALRDAGLDRVSSGEARNAWLVEAREKARSMAASAPSLAITAEDLRPFLPPAPHPNLWGAVFRAAEWEPVGFVTSKHPDAHARTVRQWRLRK